MKILLVDDSRSMRMIVKRAIRQAGFAGHDFVEASNGSEALNEIRSSPPDLVLTDWNMPEMSGIDLLLALQAEKIDVATGIISSQVTPGMRQQAIEAGAKFMLTKPVASDHLHEALERILG